MSRIGKLPVSLPDKVTHVSRAGPSGDLGHAFLLLGGGIRRQESGQQAQGGYYQIPMFHIQLANEVANVRNC